MLVEVAGAGGEIEGRAWFIVGVFLEEDRGLVVFGEGTCRRVAREPGCQADEGSGCAGFHAKSARRVILVEQGEAFAEAGRVLLGDGEDADAALGATRAAD